jgi:hypothetical protein
MDTVVFSFLCSCDSKQTKLVSRHFKRKDLLSRLDVHVENTPSLDQLTKYFETMTHYKEIYFFGIPTLTDGLVRTILDTSPLLEVLSLAYCANLTVLPTVKGQNTATLNESFELDIKFENSPRKNLRVRLEGNISLFDPVSHHHLLSMEAVLTLALSTVLRYPSSFWIFCAAPLCTTSFNLKLHMMKNFMDHDLLVEVGPKVAVDEENNYYFTWFRVDGCAMEIVLKQISMNDALVWKIDEINFSHSTNDLMTLFILVEDDDDDFLFEELFL